MHANFADRGFRCARSRWRMQQHLIACMLPLASTQQQHMAMTRRALARADNLAKSRRPRRAAAKRRCPLLVPSHLLYAIITASPRVLVPSHHPAELLAVPKPRRPPATGAPARPVSSPLQPRRLAARAVPTPQRHRSARRRPQADARPQSPPLLAVVEAASCCCFFGL